MPHFGEIRSLDNLIDVLLTALADGDILTYNAALEQWINEAPPQAATKEIWVPATIGLDGAAQDVLGDHGGYLVNASGENARIEFHVPHDFTAIDECVVACFPGHTLDPMDFYIYVDIAAPGEIYNKHSDSIFPSLAVTANRLLELDISPALADMRAGDYVGVKFLCDFGANTDALVLGVRLKYT